MPLRSFVASVFSKIDSSLMQHWSRSGNGNGGDGSIDAIHDKKYFSASLAVNRRRKEKRSAVFRHSF